MKVMFEPCLSCTNLLLILCEQPIIGYYICMLNMMIRMIQKRHRALIRGISNILGENWRKTSIFFVLLNSNHISGQISCLCINFIIKACEGFAFRLYSYLSIDLHHILSKCTSFSYLPKQYATVWANIDFSMWQFKPASNFLIS